MTAIRVQKSFRDKDNLESPTSFIDFGPNINTGDTGKSKSVSPKRNNSNRLDASNIAQNQSILSEQLLNTGLLEDLLKSVPNGVDKEEHSKSILLGIGMGMGVVLSRNESTNHPLTNMLNKSNQLNINQDTDSTSERASDTISQVSQAHTDQSNHQLFNNNTQMNSVVVESSLISLLNNNSDAGVADSVVIEITGDNATDTVTRQGCEYRISEAIDDKKRVVVLEIVDAPIQSIRNSIGKLRFLYLF
jgi:hypothetical protein